MQVLYYRTKTTLKGLEAFVGKMPQALYNEATRLQLLVAGPQYWCYFGANGDPDNEFTLEIAIPVVGKPLKETTFQLKQLSAFKSLSVLHEGSYEEMGKVYGEIMPQVLADGFSFTDDKEVREMYLNVDFEHPENCRTEILIGIK